jgi:hypothetical protein
MNWFEKLIYHFICKDFVECWRISIGEKLVLLAAGATIDHFAHRSNQVGVRSLLFQLHGSKLIFIALLI